MLCTHESHLMPHVGEPCGVIYKYLNSLWPSDAIWRYRSGSTLAQVMACCLMAPSHYLNQCWLITSKVHWHSSEGNFAKDTSAISQWNWLENYFSKILFKSPRGQWVKNLAMLYALHRSVYWFHYWWCQYLLIEAILNKVLFDTCGYLCQELPVLELLLCVHRYLCLAILV